MNISKISPDDPRLTAYALGELEDAEHAAIEAAVKDDPAAQAAIAQIRALSDELSVALAKEPLPLAVPVAFERKDEDTSAGPDPYLRRKIVRFPYVIIAGLAAACFAVMFINLRPESAKKQTAPTVANLSAPHVTAGAEHVPASTKNETVYEIALDPASDEARVAAMPAPAPEKKIFPDEKILPALSPTFPASVPQILGDSRGQVAANETGGAPAGAPRLDGIELASNLNSKPALQTSRNERDAMKLDGFVVPGEREAQARQRPAMTMAARASRKNEAGNQVRRPARADASTFNTEAYAYSKDNDYLDVSGNPLSTFSIDVDTASYTNVRRFLNDGQRPPRDAVRIEELVNYFPYRYAAPKDDRLLAASMEVAAAPWNPQHRLVRIGLKAREIPESKRPALNLVFLLDVSGSMGEPNKLPLVKESMRLLIEKLKPTDRVAIAVYAGASGLALPSTAVAKKKEILAALDSLDAGGSTNGAMGIQLAYDIARANFIEDGSNRVVLCTDGDFNVGVTDKGDLTGLIEEKAGSGIFLTVLGFGMGNYKDETLELLADKGNGNYGYVDNAAEAKKLLVDQLSGTLVTIAKDVKLQVEFNPALVQSYRLIGYENRVLKKEDFNNDRIDAGEIGAGHTVTALYEIVPAGVEPAGDVPAVDALKYQPTTGSKRAKTNHSPELLTLKIRYKDPDAVFSRKLEFPLVDSGAAFDAASQDFKFAAAVAGFGMLLRESPHKGAATFDSVLGWAEDGTGDDAGGHRHEFIALVKKARDDRG